MQTLISPCPTTDPRMINIDSLDEQDFYTNNTSTICVTQEFTN